MSSARDTSTRTASTVDALACTAAVAVSSAAVSMSAMTTFIPSAANLSASASPIPLAAPVTTATRSLNRSTGGILAAGHGSVRSPKNRRAVDCRHGG